MQLVQRLIKRGVIAASEMTRVSEAHFAAPTKPLHELLIEKGFAKEEDVLAALADEFGMELVDLTQVTVEPETLLAMPLKLVHRRSLMPLSREQRHPRRRHRRPLRRLRPRRIADDDRPEDPAGSGQPARDRPAHQDALRRRRRNRLRT